MADMVNICCSRIELFGNEPPYGFKIEFEGRVSGDFKIDDIQYLRQVEARKEIFAREVGALYERMMLEGGGEGDIADIDI